MSNELDELLMKKLGFDKPKMKQEVITIDIEGFRERIDKLNSMSNEEFNKTLRLKEGTIADFNIKYNSEKEEKCNYNNCSSLGVEFKMLFRYDLNGFKLYDNNHNIRLNYTEMLSETMIGFFQHTTIQRQNAGYFILTSEYHHHSTFCGGAYQSSVIHRSPFSLLIPNYPQMADRTNSNKEMMVELQRILSLIPKDITLENHKKFFDQVNDFTCVKDHAEDICDCNDSYCDDFHNEEAYCDRYCGNRKYMDFFLTHPHYFVEMDNFCTGSQFEYNSKLRELNQHPNPISYLSEVIKLASDINFADCFKKMEYYIDVFENQHIFAQKPIDGLQRYYRALIHSARSDRPQEFHVLNDDCFCFDCYKFKEMLKRGLKFDPSKIKFGEFPEKDLAWFNNFVTRSNWENIDIEIAREIFDISLNDEKYHISDKSKLNFFDSLLEDKFHYLGLVPNVDGSDCTNIRLHEAKEQLKPIVDLKNMIEDTKDYTTVVHNLIEELKENFSDKVSNENLDKMFAEYSKNILS